MTRIAVETHLFPCNSHYNNGPFLFAISLPFFHINAPLLGPFATFSVLWHLGTTVKAVFMAHPSNLTYTVPVYYYLIHTV